MRILAILDHPPGAFFASVFGDGPTIAADRFRASGSDLIARGIIDVPELASPIHPDTLTDIELDSLDQLRFDNPRHAADQARELAFLAGSEGRQGDASACAARFGARRSVRPSNGTQRTPLCVGRSATHRKGRSWLIAGYVLRQ